MRYLVLLLLLPFGALGQDTSNVTLHADSLVLALYDVISGPPGERDWDKLRSYCKPEAQFNAVRRTPKGEAMFMYGSVDDYIKKAGPYFKKNGFYETEISRTTEQFGAIMHVFSTYESRHEPKQEPFSRGINSIQLVQERGRWWIVNVLWDSEAEGNTIPEQYLPK